MLAVWACTSPVESLDTSSPFVSQGSGVQEYEHRSCNVHLQMDTRYVEEWCEGQADLHFSVHSLIRKYRTVHIHVEPALRTQDRREPKSHSAFCLVPCLSAHPISLIVSSWVVASQEPSLPWSICRNKLVVSRDTMQAGLRYRNHSLTTYIVETIIPAYPDTSSHTMGMVWPEWRFLFHPKAWWAHNVGPSSVGTIIFLPLQPSPINLSQLITRFKSLTNRGYHASLLPLRPPPPLLGPIYTNIDPGPHRPT